MHILVFKYGNNKTKEVYDQEGVIKSFWPFVKHITEWNNHVDKGTVTCYKLFYYHMDDDTGYSGMPETYFHAHAPSKPVRIIN